MHSLHLVCFIYCQMLLPKAYLSKMYLPIYSVSCLPQYKSWVCLPPLHLIEYSSIGYSISVYSTEEFFTQRNVLHRNFLKAGPSQETGTGAEEFLRAFWTTREFKARLSTSVRACLSIENADWGCSLLVEHLLKPPACTQCLKHHCPRDFMFLALLSKCFVLKVYMPFECALQTGLGMPYVPSVGVGLNARCSNILNPEHLWNLECSVSKVYWFSVELTSLKSEVVCLSVHGFHAVPFGL